MSDFGIVIDTGTVRFERLLPGPIERVWAYLTDSDKRAKWLAAGPMELRAGGRGELHFRHADLSPTREAVPDKYRQYEDGASFGILITRCDPPRLLSYTWGGGPGEESEVTFELTAQGDRVLLVLTHHRLADRAELLSVAGGWHTHLDILCDHLSGTVPQPFWSTHARIEGEYEKRLAGA